MAKSERLIRAQDIVMELSDSLDRSTGAIVYESLTPVEANVYLRAFPQKRKPRQGLSDSAGH